MAGPFEVTMFAKVLEWARATFVVLLGIGGAAQQVIL